MPAVADYPFVRTQVMDYSKEKKSTTFNVGPITALTIAGLLTQIGDFNAALQDVIFGTITQEAFGVVDQVSNARPASAAAQVETRMLIGYVDNVTGAPESESIYTVDYTKFNYSEGEGAGDYVVIAGAGASAETVALIDAIEAMAKFPGTNNAITVTYMKVVR
jgi:hypothetical protein